MYNLTLALDKAVVQSARLRAVNEGTTLSAKVRELLVQYAHGQIPTSTQNPALEIIRFAESLHKSGAKQGSYGRKWTRDELHERSSQSVKLST